MVSGIGIALVHPEGGAGLANLAAGEHKGTGMSIFAVGGNVGFFVGPLLCATFVGSFGLTGTWVFLVPALPWRARSPRLQRTLQGTRHLA